MPEDNDIRRRLKLLLGVVLLRLKKIKRTGQTVITTKAGRFKRRLVRFFTNSIVGSVKKFNASLISKRDKFFSYLSKLRRKFRRALRSISEFRLGIFFKELKASAISKRDKFFSYLSKLRRKFQRGLRSISEFRLGIFFKELKTSATTRARGLLQSIKRFWRKIFQLRKIKLSNPFHNLKIVLGFGDKNVHADERWMNLFKYFYDLRSGKKILFLNLQRILPLLALMAVLGYAGAAGGLYYWLDRKPHNEIGFWDIALPFRWSTLREKQGRGFIAEGLEDLEKESYATGIRNLRIGLIKYPEDADARLELARIYAGFGAVERAMQTLEEGLKYSFPGVDYLSLLFETTFFAENYDLTLEVTGRLLRDPEKIPDPSIRALLLKNRIHALLKSDQYQQALRLCRRLNRDEDQSLNAVDGEVLALFGLKRYAQAVALLEVLRLESEFDPNLLRLLAQAYRHMGNLVELRDILQYLIDKNSRNPQPYLFALEEWRHAGKPGEIQVVFENYLAVFAKNERAIQVLAARLAAWPESRLVKRCLGTAELQGFNTHPFLILLVQSLLADGQWHEASIAFSLLERSEAKQTDDTLKIAPYMMKFLSRLLIALEPGDETGPSILMEFFSNRRFPVAIYLTTAHMFEQSGKWSASREILGMASNIFPHSATIVDRLNMVDQQLEKIKTTSMLIETESAKQVITTQEDTLTALDNLIDSANLPGALALIRKLRRENPPWHLEVEEELAWRQLLIIVAQGDAHYTKPIVRISLEKYPQWSAKVLDLARDYSEQGNYTAAKILGTQVANLFPDTSEPIVFLESLPPVEITTEPALAILMPSSLVEALEILDSHIEKGESVEANILLKELRRHTPEWLTDAQDELAWRQLLANLTLDDLLYVQSLIHRYLADAPEGALRVLVLARKYVDGNNTDMAKALAGAVIEAYPGNAEAVVFLQALEDDSNGRAVREGSLRP